VRTAIAIVGFGLIVVKLGDGGATPAASGDTGLALLILGMVLIAAADIRLLVIRRLIRSKKLESGLPVVLDIGLAVGLIIMITALTGFDVHVAGLF